MKAFTVRRCSLRMGVNWLLFTVATTAAGGQTTPASWRAVPELRIDGERHDLIQPNFVLVGRGGQIFVGQGQDNQIVLFDALGKKAGQVGKTGSGPGEFRGLSMAGFVGDSLWAYDLRLRRTTIFAPSNRFARSITITSVANASSEPGASKFLDLPQTRAVYGDGTLLVMPSVSVRRVEGTTPGAALLRVDKGDSTTSRVRSTVVRLPSDSGRVIHWTSDTTNFGFSIPGFPSPLHAVSSDGRRIAVVTTRLSESTGGTLTVTLLSDSGRRILSRDIPVIVQSISARAADSMIAARTKVLAVHMRETFAREARKRIPSAFAPASEVRFGNDGTIWIAMRSTSTTRPYLVLDGNAQPIGNISLPRNTYIETADRKNVWAVEVNSDGIPSIVRFRIEF